jgi:hypothetical protein
LSLVFLGMQVIQRKDYIIQMTELIQVSRRFHHFIEEKNQL